MKTTVSEASTVWDSLKGLIAVCKPFEVSCNAVRKTIVSNICKELCELQCRSAIPHVQIEGNALKQLTVTVHDSYADHPAVTGPRYQPKDVRCTWPTFLSRQTTGLLVLGINGGTRIAQAVSKAKPTRAYRIHGVFGSATDNYFRDGRVVEKSTFNHIRQHHLDSLLSAMQASHQKKMFELCGLDIQSQAAYELTTKGLIRPADSNLPLLYGIKCIYFELPNFTIEVQCVNEYEKYLKTLIHDIGMQMHATAHCTGVQCIRHGYFTLEHALLRKHWTLQHILHNMSALREFQQRITTNQTARLQQIN